MEESLRKELEKLSLGEDADISLLIEAMKSSRIAWTPEMKKRYNKQELVCETCKRKFQRGGKARHLTTKVHKKAVRKIKRAQKKAKQQ